MLEADLISAAAERIKDFRELQEAGLIALSNQFFPSVHYPPITMYPPAVEEELFRGYQNPPDGLFVIYVHIPFCMRYCTFCHYPNKIGDLPEEKDRYLRTLQKEMDLYLRRLDLPKIKARSILVGGGTPTYLSPSQMERFFKIFLDRVDLERCSQFNYDVDPLTLLGEEGRERLRIMKEHGVDRLTIGIQSLNDEILARMNRPHTAEEALRAIDQVRQFGFQANIEFIFGFPGETLESWIKTLEKASSLDVEEIQIYRLKILPYGDHSGLILKKYSNGGAEFPDIETVLTMKEAAIQIFARHGYRENLRRVFSRKTSHFSHYAHHQCCTLSDQIGLGLTAFHSLRDRFCLNTQSFEEYYSLIEQDRLPINRGLVRNRDHQLRWHIVLPLKNRMVFKSAFQKRTGVSLDTVFRKKIERLKDFNLLFEDDQVLRLTPRGNFFADEVCHQFHHPDYIPFPADTYRRGPLHPYLDTEP